MTHCERMYITHRFQLVMYRPGAYELHPDNTLKNGRQLPVKSV